MNDIDIGTTLYFLNNIVTLYSYLITLFLFCQYFSQKYLTIKIKNMQKYFILGDNILLETLSLN